MDFHRHQTLIVWRKSTSSILNHSNGCMKRAQEFKAALGGRTPRLAVVPAEIVASFPIQHLRVALHHHEESSNDALNILSVANFRAHQINIKIKSRDLSNVLISKRRLI